VQYLAYYDDLTGLANRSLFNQRLNHALNHASRYNNKLALLFIDLDRFKNINDTLGHHVGDELLKEMANRFKRCIRARDTIARLGGDEFVVILEDIVDVKHAASVARKIGDATLKPFITGSGEYNVTVSIGISTYPDDGKDEQTLMKHADIAMYQAKDRGRNNYQLYSAQINSHSVHKLALESSLRHALERDEILLHYQPKVSLDNGGITGMEALVRWDHPDLGMISPVQFIPLAEETGLIVPIGRWILNTACAQNKAWLDQGFPPLRVSVNLSARQFNDENLMSDIARTLKESGLPPSLLDLEITESMVMQNPDRAVKILKKLRSMEIAISMDDFGTGYSSLSQLKRFPINTIKIDRSFINDAINSEEDAAITEAIIAMGRALRLNVVAEGVETAEQVQFLRKHRCDELQGYYFSKPIPGDEFAQLLRTGKVLGREDRSNDEAKQNAANTCSTS
jgi:diguanylate cyclase (GGDEF)-like protein